MNMWFADSHRARKWADPSRIIPIIVNQRIEGEDAGGFDDLLDLACEVCTQTFGPPHCVDYKRDDGTSATIVLDGFVDKCMFHIEVV